MPSEFDIFAREFATGALVEQFAETSAIYYPPANASPVEIDRVILSASEYTVEPDFESDELMRKERRTAKVPIEVMSAAGITGVQTGAQLEIYGERWVVDAGTTKWEMMVVLGLTRKPLVRKQEGRRANV